MFDGMARSVTGQSGIPRVVAWIVAALAVAAFLIVVFLVVAGA
jgi:hypothetical protein